MEFMLMGQCGGAGHSLQIAKCLSSNGLLIGIDRDEEALRAARENLKEFQNVKYVHDNHDNIDEIINNYEILLNKSKKTEEELSRTFAKTCIYHYFWRMLFHRANGRY